MTRADCLSLFTTCPQLLIPSEATEFLCQLDSTVDLLLLFRHYFPEQFSAAMAEGTPLIAEKDACYSKMERKFFILVHTHLFPLPLYWEWDDLFDGRRFAYEIPVEPFGIDLDCDGYDSLPLGWVLVLYLINQLGEEEVRRYGGEVPDALFAIPRALGESVSRSLLARRCQAQGGPLAYLPHVIEMLHNETGTVWLDATINDSCYDAGWTKACVDDLAEAYELATDIQAKATSCCDWLEEDPLPRFAQLARLVAVCARDTPRESSRPKSMAVSADRFVEGIDRGELFGRYITLPAGREEE